jgi:stage II sporulation protein D
MRLARALAPLLVLLGPAGAAAGAGTEPVRVLLGDGLRVVEVSAPEPMVLSEAAGRRALAGPTGLRVVRVAPGPGGLEVGDRRLPVPAVRLETRRGPLRVGGRDYPGAIEVWRSGEGLLVVNEVALEEYVAGTVRGEAPERWPAEALRALAVVARTYAVFHRGRNGGGRPFHVAASSQDQNFTGRVPEGSPAGAAARATVGQVLTWQGRVFPAFYHSDSGGVTEAPQTIFSGDGIPPLGGVRDQFAADSPHATWTVTLPLATIGARLRQAGFDVGEVTRLTAVERSASLRVLRVAVEHLRGVLTVRGTDLRRALGYDVLRSTFFDLVAVDSAVRFEGRGWGHGVGLSQFGAKGMAERGYLWPQILQHYYPGTTLMTLP